RKEYGPNETVRICSTIENPSDADFSIVVNAQLADARGHIVDVAAHETGPAVKLGAGASESVTLLWNTGMSQPGAYSVRFHVADAASGSVVDDRKLAFVVTPSVVVDDLDLVVSPSNLNQDEKRTVDMCLTLQNRSNTDAFLTAELLVKDPEGAVVHEGRVDLELPLTTAEGVLELPPLTHVFDRCGQYPVEVSVRSGEVLCGQVRTTIRVAAATRIDVVKTVDPATVTPDGDKRVRVAIRLEGVGATVNPSFLSAGTNTGGDRITIAFDKAMAEPGGGVPLFTVTADGAPCPVTEVLIGESDITRIDLVLAAAVARGQEILVSYAGSILTCVEGKPLMPFDDEAVANRVSPPIFNQDGYGFSGSIAPNPLAPRTVMTGYGQWPRGFYKNVLSFAGAVFDGQAIWMVPANADSVVRVDTGTGEMTAFNRWPEGFSKGGHAFAGGIFDGECLWMIPSYADSVVKLDTGTGEMTRYNAWPKGYAKGGYAFAGGIYDGRHIWMVPANADSVVIVDTRTGEMSAYSGWPEGLGKVEYAFAGGIYDGRHIWLVPYYADRVVKVDCQTGEMTGHHRRPEGLGKVEYAFAGGVFDGQGIWMIPLNADRVIRIDKDTAEVTEYAEWPQGFMKGVNAFAGGVFDGESIWMVPSYADRVVRISSFSSLSLSAAITASDSFSAYISQDESGEGRLAGRGKGWSSVHTLNAALVPGLTNYLHVKCVDTAGPVAAFMADLVLNDESFHFADGSRHLVTSESGWRVYTDRFGGTEGSVTAVCRNGEGSWSTRFGIDLDANWIWTGRGMDKGARFFSIPIYYSPVPVAPMEDVVIIDTIAGGKVAVDEGSFTREPSRVEQGGDGTVIEWRLREFRVGQREDIYFNVMLRDTTPGERRLVNHSLDVAYKDASGAMARRELGPCHVLVLSSPFDCSIGTERQVYRMGEDVVIFCFIRNLSDLPRTLDVRVMMEDAQGVLIDQTLIRDVRCAPGEDMGIDGLVFKLVATNAGPHRLRLLHHEGEEETDLAEAGFMVEDVPATGIPTQGVSVADVEERAGRVGAVNVSEESGADECGRAEGVLGPVPEGLPEGALEGLEGTISAQPSPIFQGLSETIYYTVTQGDGGDLTGLSVNVVIADGETGKARQSFSAPRAHFKGRSFAGSFTFSTGALEPGEYRVKLMIPPGSGSEAREIATTSFVIRRIDMVVT
ncbi:MAG TPA: SwmB domain-containing protein, partial [Syntrophorhabdaceae bacterium]|nr:SwmB domain-containing protein [Syntrophorhabdaceae bacterium]